MAKINHNNYLNTIGDLIRDAKNKGIVHLIAENNDFSGRKFSINGMEMVNFGTCGYLGLEMDQRLKDGVLDYTTHFGTQFSVSRTYLTSGPNADLEIPISKIYDGKHVIVYPSTSSAHIANIPCLVRDTDLVIIDQQVHMSVQTGAQLAQVKGTKVDMIRHSNLQMLEDKIKENRDKFGRIWYLIDGVYSMYGDVAPIEELLALMDKYEQLHLYVDDAHGMSWYGRNGAGYIYDTVGVPDRMILVTTLAKGFGTVGGITVFPNIEQYEKVKIFGGPLTYSHPIPPPIIGAAIASANIHLSEEIYSLQRDLKQRISYCNELLSATSLPVISNPLTPIYFVGMGQPKVGYSMVRRMMDEGYFLNIALFPAVPVKNTGVRFTLTRHIHKSDIKGLVDAMAHHFPLVLEEAGKTENDVRKAFSLFPFVPSSSKLSTIHEPVIGKEFKVQHETSITKIDREEWDNLLGNNGAFNWDAIKFMQDSFSGNPLPEDNWDFHIYIVRDRNKKPIIATFFSIGIYKDDLLSAYGVSVNIENKRKTDPYYLTSKTIGMGSLVTEGQHIYIDRNNLQWKEAFKLLEEELYLLQEKTGASNILLRDFEISDTEIQDFLIEEGFFKIEMPNANVVQNMTWNNYDEYCTSLSKKNRIHARQDVFKNEHFFDIVIQENLSEEEILLFHKLYQDVKARNFAINYFPYPEKMFRTMSSSPGWEFVIQRLKPEFHPEGKSQIVSIMGCFKSTKVYTTVVIGMDYDFVYDFGVYRQSLFQGLKRARQLGYEKVFMGFSADFEKKKLGAIQIPRASYVQAKDNFNFELLETISVSIEAA
jgi:7-keto-8-aminopelargonate synthetase-like enzyme